ncbi:MurR/RpiR family transcriptional regulator [Tabrizicola sp.]|uniref:MurR/RpiR family transcriptional regulator n=1 Tax=Tabrizicola sp. TaxID=2005166 RepID=UPI00286AA5D7|nr:MurR/RpiR family transcriptional regulator [Tabrizicola sp.]
MPDDSVTLRKTAPATVDEFRARLASELDSMPKRLRQCADFIARNTDRIAVSTVADLAAGADVPPSAVMRFCQILGFSGFSDMQRLFREAYAPGWPDYATRLRNLKAGASGGPAALVAQFVEAGRLSLEGLASTLDEAALDRAVAILAGAQTIHIIGFRRSFPVSIYLAYMFEKMAVPAMLHDGVGHLDHRFAMRPGDAVLAIAFAPYSVETLNLTADACARSLPVVALTDNLASPLAQIADVTLTVAEVDFGAFRSLSATIALAISLAVAVGSARE